MTEKITEVPNVERDQMIANIENIKRNLPHIIEFQILNSKIAFAKYNAYVDAGFNEQQALFLVANSK